MSLTERIRSAAQQVTQQADFVTLHTDKITAYTQMLLQQYPLVTTWGEDVHVKSPAYVLALDSINFGSGYFHVARKYGLDLEYDNIAGSLKKYFEKELLDTPEKWTLAVADDFHALLNIPKGLDCRLDELMQNFALHLAKTGERILADYFDVVGFLKACGNSALHMAEIAASWPSFDDHYDYDYKGMSVPVFKRAQILAADMNLVMGGTFKDIDALTIFADNMVPHVLRCDGILEYTPTLSQKIDRGETLERGSPEEIEIRCCAIHAVELMRKTAKDITSVNLDHILWRRGYEPQIYSKSSHRCFTTAY